MTLVVQMNGLPGSGKSTLARALAPLIDAIALDKDVIKAALLRSGVDEARAGRGAYEAHFALGSRLIAEGHSIILDNPVHFPEVFAGWQRLATEAGSPLIMLTCVCGDAERERRVLTRDALESQPRALLVRPPGSYEPPCEDVRIDTARPLEQALADALVAVRARAALAAAGAAP